MNSSICLLGSSNSGKTSFVNKLINSDPLFNSPTIGVEYTSQYFKTNDGIITWNIWDCGGFYKCLNIFSSYISNSDIYLVFLDISRPIRYQEIDNYFKIINDIKYNQIQHQFEDTECGVYSINFIVRLVGGETFTDITNNIKNDDFMNNCRKSYFKN